MSDPTRFNPPAPPADLESQAVDTLAPMWERAGFPVVAYPVETADVLRLFDAWEYRCDLDFIQTLIGHGVLTVPLVAGRRQWGPCHVLHLLGQLEGRRRWRWPSALHAFKFSVPERMQAEAETAGRVSAFDDLDRWDVEALLLFLEESETRAARHAIRVAIMSKLRSPEGAP